MGREQRETFLFYPSIARASRGFIAHLRAHLTKAPATQAMPLVPNQAIQFAISPSVRRLLCTVNVNTVPHALFLSHNSYRISERFCNLYEISVIK